MIFIHNNIFYILTEVFIRVYFVLDEKTEHVFLSDTRSRMRAISGRSTRDLETDLEAVQRLFAWEKKQLREERVWYA